VFEGVINFLKLAVGQLLEVVDYDCIQVY
jgi:hypothetical protein